MCLPLKPYCTVRNQGNGIHAIALNQNGFTAGYGQNLKFQNSSPCHRLEQNVAGDPKRLGMPVQSKAYRFKNSILSGLRMIDYRFVLMCVFAVHDRFLRQLMPVVTNITCHFSGSGFNL